MPHRLGCCTNRIVQFNGVVTLLAGNGSLAGSKPITSNGTVSTVTFRSPAPAPTPNPSLAVQLDPLQRQLAVRYVRVNASAGQCLTFREIFVLDTTYTNVALLKPATASPQNTSSSVFSAASGNNGVIDFDNVTSGDMVYSAACDGSAWWQVDLGGIFNLSTVIVFNM